MTDLLLGIAEYLVANNLASGDGVDIFRDYIPTDPDNIIIISEYNSLPQIPGVECVDRSIQIKVRNIDVDAGKALSWKIYNLLFKVYDKEVSINGSYAIFNMRTSPIKVDVDSQDRAIWCFNVGVIALPDK